MWFGKQKKKIMSIEVRIPFSSEGDLATAYNKALADCKTEWVLFLDHDVFLCNPLWYQMCETAIEKVSRDHDAACITCLCGGERHKSTMKRTGEEPEDCIEEHIRMAKNHYHKYGTDLELIGEYAAGYFLLLNVEIAKDIGFRPQGKGINNIDADFGTRLLDAGYHIYLMPGLYVYHRRGMKHLKKAFEDGIR